jgi:hypothetical protein
MAPTALKTAGVPVDQLSFLENDGHLNVLLRESGRGEGMWGSERTSGAMALLRVPLSLFGDGHAAAQREHYRKLPGPASRALQNRFVGDWLLWGGAGTRAWALRYAAASSEPVALEPGHAIERIEALGRHALLVGNAGEDLQFSSVRLTGDGARIADRFVQAGARQGETRTHGFFFQPGGAEDGLLGLPVLRLQEPGRFGVYAGGHGSAAVLYLRQHELAFQALGQLQANAESPRDDACKASCVDWYGNARPIFLGARVFALLGYELVEGQITRGGFAERSERIEERRRISFAPLATTRDARYSPFN